MEENRLFEHPEQYSLCLRVRERLPDLLEGYLDAVAAEAIRAHLSVCFMCARIYGEMEKTVRLVETLPFAEPVEDFAPAIMAALRGQPPGHSFQAPVVEVETEIPIVVSWPRTTTGPKRPANDKGAESRESKVRSREWDVKRRAEELLRPSFRLLSSVLARLPTRLNTPL